MRLPTLDGKPYSKRIDRKQATRMIRRAIDSGVNYIDTAYRYHGGASEALLAEVLKDGYRERVKLVTKSPIWMIRKSTDYDKFLNRQLRSLRTDQIDFYLFHGLNKGSWKGVVKRHGLLRRATAAIRDGRVGGIGFSFHDDLKTFKEIVDGYDEWSLAQIQYNYMDTNNQAGTKGLKYAASKGLGVVVMEPLLGGRLANPPRMIKAILRGKGMSAPDLALRWVWNQPEVSVVLSGMSTMRQVKGNLASAERSGIGSLGSGDLKLVERIKRRYLETKPVPCTKCGYCMPCPHGVNIPLNFEEYNDGFIYGDLKTARLAYGKWMKKKERAEACQQCRKCEAKCPQKIPISEMMKKVHAVLGEGRRA
ncbi:MAG: aldo/keto reductase [Methanomassiliicoccales archaeon]|nr:aldo/keto reductase [Methanomassiliicoccales archaeon]